MPEHKLYGNDDIVVLLGTKRRRATVISEEVKKTLPWWPKPSPKPLISHHKQFLRMHGGPKCSEDYD